MPDFRIKHVYGLLPVSDDYAEYHGLHRYQHYPCFYASADVCFLLRPVDAGDGIALSLIAIYRRRRGIFAARAMAVCIFWFFFLYLQPACMGQHQKVLVKSGRAFLLLHVLPPIFMHYVASRVQRVFTTGLCLSCAFVFPGPAQG